MRDKGVFTQHKNQAFAKFLVDKLLIYMGFYHVDKVGISREFPLFRPTCRSAEKLWTGG